MNWRAHAALIAVGMALYVAIHAGAVAPNGVLRHHGADVIAGAVLLSLLELAPDSVKPVSLTHLLSNFGGKMALIGGAAVSWEVLVPLLSPASTPDWLDLAAYLLGGSIQHLLGKLAHEGRRAT